MCKYKLLYVEIENPLVPHIQTDYSYLSGIISKYLIYMQFWLKGIKITNHDTNGTIYCSIIYDGSQVLRVGFGFRVSGFGFRSSKPTLAVGFGFRVPGFGFRVSLVETNSADLSPDHVSFKHILCSIIYRIILPIDFHILQDG